MLADNNLKQKVVAIFANAKRWFAEFSGLFENGRAISIAVLASVTLSAGPAVGVNPGNPATAPSTADVDVTNALITITENAGLDFGVIVPPTTGIQIFTIDANTGAISAGAGDGQTAGGHQRANFSIDGDDGRDYNLIVAASGTCSSPLLILVPQESDATSAPRVLDETIDVGGDLTVNALTPPGPHTCPYIVTAFYI